MGTNNRQRRAAKKRQRARDARSGLGRSTGPAPDGPDLRDLTAAFVHEALQQIAADPGVVDEWVTRLRELPAAATVLPRVLAHLHRDAVAGAVDRGWSAHDLAQLVRRRLPEHGPALAAELAEQAARHPAATVTADWRSGLAELGPPVAADPGAPEGVRTVLELCALLVRLPEVPAVGPPPGAAPAGPGGADADPKVLARVRALLAKAESTEFTEEAEALSAKAQELMSRHALDRLVADVDRGEAPEPVVRRLWIDAPYVLPKAMLVAAVAEANRCRSVLSEELGFTTLVGQRADLSATELLVTSLLVQADTALLRHGRQTEGRRSRTASFRRSFLLSYAQRIGERLRGADGDALASTGRAGELVPVLRRRSEQVDEATAQLFPDVTARGATVTNERGWVAGRAAADVASLVGAPQVT